MTLPASAHDLPARAAATGAAPAGATVGATVGANAGANVGAAPVGPARGPVLRVLPGTADSAGAARQLARQLLGDGDPSVETVMLVVSELVTNAIVHTHSGAPGGTITVALCPGPAGTLVQVRDDGGTSEPCLAAAGGGGEHGYGLLLVDTLAESWGTLPSPDGRITWCRVGGRPGMAGSAASG
jgi:anti-sigma regulatory factor (Ser/Thr protein kinase)